MHQNNSANLNAVRVKEISSADKEYWDREIQRFECVHPLNAFAWGQIRSVDNWLPVYLVAEREEKFCGGMMILEKRLPFTPFTIFYSPKGPVCDYQDTETLSSLVDSARKLATKKKAIFIRVDPNLREQYLMDHSDSLTSMGFTHLEQRWTPWNSPRDVSRIDLTRVGSAEDLFKRLDRDTRRCIRKASREGVTIEAATSEEELRTFYNIFKEFSVNKRFMSRDYEYQKTLWRTYVNAGLGRLFLAKYEGKIIGGLICIMFGKKCLAMHMGTPYVYQKLQTYYAYVWESIKWAKEKDCTWYSFRGVGTTPSQEYFKNKFLPERVCLIGYYDLPFRPILYRLFYFGEFTALPIAWHLVVNVRKFFNAISNRLRECKKNDN